MNGVGNIDGALFPVGVVVVVVVLALLACLYA